MKKKSEFCGLILSAVRKESMKKLIFSRPDDKDAPIKISVRLCAHRGQRLLAAEYTLPGNTVSQKNVKTEAAEAFLMPLLASYRQANLLTSAGDAEYKRKGDKEVFLGADALTRKLSGDTASFALKIDPLDREKQYILTGKEPFLAVLGIADKNGRIHDKRQGKFRQINRFLEYLSDLYGVLPKEGTLRVYDLCCGKSYLSFAVYHYLTALCGRTVDMLCMDLKRDVLTYCEGCAAELGFSGMRFVVGDIRNLEKDDRPDMVISLHACDTATDIVLDTAMRLGAKVILSTPCCHRYLTDKISMPDMEFVTEYPHLKNKLCELLTDAIRLARLRAHGYTVSAPELTDPDDTPKNTLLRAVKIADGDPQAEKDYRDILSRVLGDGAADYLKEIRTDDNGNL